MAWSHARRNPIGSEPTLAPYEGRKRPFDRARERERGCGASRSWRPAPWG